MTAQRIDSVEPEGVAAAYDPIEVLVDGPRVLLQVDAEHACFELTASKALQLAQALQRGAFLAGPLDDSGAVPIVRRLVECLDDYRQTYDTQTQLSRPHVTLDSARAWLARHR